MGQGRDPGHVARLQQAVEPLHRRIEVAQEALQQALQSRRIVAETLERGRSVEAQQGRVQPVARRAGAAPLDRFRRGRV